MKSFKILFVLFLALNFQTLANAQRSVDYSGKDMGRAPPWKVSEWVVGPELDFKKQKGKVVLIDFFQLWCPGCKSFSIPTFALWEERFAEEIEAGKLQLVSIHTVFEGHEYQNLDRLRKFVSEWGFNHPVANDQQHEDYHIPATMLAYATRGTPEVAIIDKFGRKRFQHIGRFDVARVERLIEDLLVE